MNKNRFYLFLVISLILSNALLLFLLFGKPRKDGRFGEDRPKNMVIEKLRFDKNQIAEYEKLIQNHRHQIREKDDEILKLKNELYSDLKNSQQNSAKNDSIIAKIADVQKQVEYIHFQHFLEIKKLCRPEQKAYFDQLADEISAIFSMRPSHRK